MGLLLLLLHGLLLAFLGLLTLRAVLGVVPLFVRAWEPRGGLRVLAEFVLTLTDPPLRWLQRFVPPVRVGTVSIDLAFTVLYALVALLAGWI